MRYKMFIWHGVLPALFNEGMAVAISSDAHSARELVLNQFYKEVILPLDRKLSQLENIISSKELLDTDYKEMPDVINAKEATHSSIRLQIVDMKKMKIILGNEPEIRELPTAIFAGLKIKKMNASVTSMVQQNHQI